jgi:hypothetical protein
MCQVELFVVFELWIEGLCSFLEHVFVSDVSSYCPCLGVRDLSSSIDLDLCLSFGFRSLVGIPFSRLFYFPFSLVTKTCVLSMHSSAGKLRAMCGSRTDGRFLV